jgi:hypothetical protein
VFVREPFTREIDLQQTSRMSCRHDARKDPCGARNQVSERENAHRQIMLDADEQDARIIEVSELQSVEEFIAKFLRAMRRIEEKSKASS